MKSTIDFFEFHNIEHICIYFETLSGPIRIWLSNPSGLGLADATRRLGIGLASTAPDNGSTPSPPRRAPAASGAH
jgi:hypothetical protein